MAKLCRITVTDEVWCTVSGLHPTELAVLYDQFGPHVEGYFFSPQYKLGRWDGRIRFFHKTGKTYHRLLDKILPCIEAWGYDFDLVDKRSVLPPPQQRATPDLFANQEVYGRPFQLRGYQVECINACIEAGSGFIIAGTGAGKTAITAGISHLYTAAGYRAITIVPSSDLVDQTASLYEQLGLDTGRYDGADKDINHANVVSTWQALQHNPSLLRDFQVFIWDECHGLKAKVAQQLVNEHGKHMPFRFGVTGTFPKPEADRMALHATIGPILKEIPASWLIEQGYLAKLAIQPLELNETYVEEEFPDYAAERAFVSRSRARLELIADIIVSMCAKHGNTLVLVNSILFGQRLAALIKDAVFLYGESPKDLRQEHYKLFEERDDLIVIASSGIASTGISIDRVFCLVMVDPMKSFIRAIQSIGRGLRRAKDKDMVHVVDLHSKLKWARKHWREREKYYKEAGYTVLKKLTVKVDKA
jgi:superfamily II DNA or RNA helicase